MRIAFFEIEGWEEQPLREAFPDAEFFLSKEKTDEMSPPPANEFEIISVFVDSRITPETLTHFPKARLITTRSTGYDHIDVPACAKREISVAYVPGYGDHTVAEFTFGLLLNLTRKIYWAIDRIKETESFSLEGLRGTDLKGKTIGIVGTGRIGTEMIKIANGFGMKVIAFDLVPKQELAYRLGFTYTSLNTLLAQSDVVSIHCPLNEKTYHLINKRNIGMMKRGAYLLNTARGGIVETGALVEALNSGIIAGAGIDVLEEEGETKDEMKFLSRARPHEKKLKTILQNHVLMKMPNVLITPHNAFNSQEALERILRTTIENIKGFLAGKPQNLVT